MTLTVELTEKEWMEQIRGLARMLGYRVYHTHRSKRSEPGFPDLVMVDPVRKRVLFVELKSSTGKLSEAQTDWLNDLNAAGAEAYCWRPEDLQTVADILTGKEVTMT